MTITDTEKPAITGIGFQGGWEGLRSDGPDDTPVQSKAYGKLAKQYKNKKIGRDKLIRGLDGIFDFSGVKELTVDEISDKTLPSVFGEFDLEVLELQFLPNLTSVPDWVAGMENLKTLSLMSLPQLGEVPDWVCELQALENLIIYNTPLIEHLPDNLQSLPNLTELSLCWMERLESIPNGFVPAGGKNYELLECLDYINDPDLGHSVMLVKSD